MQQPKLLSKVWAALGLKNDIPDSRKTGIPNESATYEDGFPQITMTPIALGGKAPSGKDMNGILNELSAHTVYQNQGGIYKFDSAFAEKIGGYSKGSLLINNKLDKLFISLVDKNKTDFNSQDFSGKWEVVSGVNFFVPKTQKATLQETGIVKLYSGYDSDSEEMAATPKVIKILKSWIDAITRNLSNYIPNSKKSSSVDSNSADDVATSAAVKTAYDKAVAAKNVADNAVAIENDATYQNSRIRIGWLRTSPYGAYLLVDSTNQGRIVTNNYLSPLVNSTDNQIPASVAGVKIAYDKAVDVENKALMKTGGVVTGDVDFKKSDWSGVNFYNTALDFVRLEGNPAGSNYALTIAYRSQGKALYAAYLPKKNGEILLNRGDTQIYGRHFFESDNSWISVRSTTADTAGYDLAVKNGKYSQVTYAAGKVGNYGVEARIFVTPEGANFDTDRRQHVFSVGEGGVMWTPKYGLLHDYFHHAGKNYVSVKQEDGLAGLHINRSNGKRARIELINDTQWKFWLEGSYDIFLPKKGGTVALLDDVKTVARKDYSRTIKGTRPDWDNATSKNISVTGYVCIYPDGRIEQFFYFRNFRVNWFDFEPIRDTHFRQVEIPVQLWTAMPTKVTWVEAHISRTNDTNIWSQRTVGAEAGEWTKPIWAFEKQGSIKDRTNIYTRRINGDTGETVDMMIKVEGY